MQNIFIAIGGSGTKVAEALVRLLAIGFPTRRTNGILTSTGESLQIWRLDPDKGAQASESLQSCVTEYHKLQTLMGNGKANTWAMDIDPHVRHLDPLDLGELSGQAKGRKNLRSLLNSGTKADSQPFLTTYYAPKELDIEVDKGFYQKPFIGAPVMAIFAQTLLDENSPAGAQLQMNAMAQNAKVRFFLCGSLYGGTGACGVPVMAQFLSQFKRASASRSGWRLGGCLLAPYCLPKEPPLSPLKPGERITEELLEQQVQAFGTHEAFAGMTKEQRRTLVRQILEGFYADPKEMNDRARQILRYYKEENIYQDFDDLYLVGKAKPDVLPLWSNGGSSQRNPLNSAETVAALSALDFFAQSNHEKDKKWIVPTAAKASQPEKLRLSDLPQYRVDFFPALIDPERVFLTTSLVHHVLQHQIPWHEDAKRWDGFDKLRAFYLQNPSREREDREKLPELFRLLSEFVLTTLDPQKTLGWEGGDANRLRELVRSDPSEAKAIGDLMNTSLFKRKPDPITLGQSAVQVSTKEIANWWPDGNRGQDGTEFTRGHYFRFLWARIYEHGLNAMMR